jgi:hypothetical protein
MREEYWYYSLWLVVVGSWVIGLAYGKWWGGYSSFLAELGQIISIPRPDQMELWQPLVYFTLTTVASFALSQLFFGIGGAAFLFARGVYDSGLITTMETTITSWKLTSVTSAEIWTIFFLLLVLAVNLPLCLWAAQLGAHRAIRMLYRLRGKPTKPIAGTEPISRLILIITLSLIAGLTATFALAST